MRPQNVDTPRFLIALYVGIGDAVSIGLSAIDRIVKHDPDASGKIDVLCNDIQEEMFRYDPRINRCIRVDKTHSSTPEIATWLTGLIVDAKTAALVRFLRNRHYQAVFPGLFDPGFFVRLHAPVMSPSPLKMAKDLLSLRSHADMPISAVARQMVDRYFGKALPESIIDTPISLYISAEHIRQARIAIDAFKARSAVPQEACRVLVVSPDTASIVTRPPTALLVEGIANALRLDPCLIVTLLPSYTERDASSKIMDALTPSFPDRIFLLPAEPRLALLEVTAIIDQADVFVTGDTGIMHLAAATKLLSVDASEEEKTCYNPENTVKIIALFGGTNPGFYGYSKRTIILGKGRKEQAAYRPGIAKESYHPRGRNLFDHITPQQLTEAIMK